jgi:hypothetical protein
MKTFLNSFTGIALTASLLVATTGCDRFNDIQPEPVAEGSARLGTIDDLSNTGFDPALFAQKIEARLTGKVPGFGYRIWVNGVSYKTGIASDGGAGKARYAIDAPALDYTAQTRQDVASCTKFVTALTVLRILERNGKTANELVWPYLPSYFNVHADFKKLRFLDLFSHTSGIVNYANADTQNGELNDIQDSVEDGIQLAEYKAIKYDYENMNYTICRVITPYLVAKLENPGLLTILKQMEGQYAQLNVFLASGFRHYVQQEVMKPAGLVAWNQVDFQNWGSPANQFTKYYPNNITNVPGNDDPSNLQGAGSGGLVISADELVQVVAAARAGKIVSANTYKQMKAGKIGVFQLGFDNNIIGEHGSYFHKNGGTGNVSAVIMDFQGKSGNESAVNVQVAITANMGSSEAGSPGVWAALFDQSWK